jgi:16S rRNA processing protein RimM
MSSLRPEGMSSERIAIGRVRKPFGLRGQFYADAFGKALGAMRTPARVFYGKNEADAISIRLTEIRQTPRGFIGKFEGIDSIEDAQQMRGVFLFLEKNELPSLGSNEYYHFELEGMTVVDEQTNTPMGVVAEMQSFPTTDALVVRKDDGTTVLIAMNNGIVRKIDRDKGCVLVNGSSLEDIV